MFYIGEEDLTFLMADTSWATQKEHNSNNNIVKTAIHAGILEWFSIECRKTNTKTVTYQLD